MINIENHTFKVIRLENLGNLPLIPSPNSEPNSSSPDWFLFFSFFPFFLSPMICGRPQSHYPKLIPSRLSLFFWKIGGNRGHRIRAEEVTFATKQCGCGGFLWISQLCWMDSGGFSVEIFLKEVTCLLGMKVWVISARLGSGKGWTLKAWNRHSGGRR